MPSFYEREEKIKKDYTTGKTSKDVYQKRLAKVHAEMAKEYGTGPNPTIPIEALPDQHQINRSAGVVRGDIRQGEQPPAPTGAVERTHSSSLRMMSAGDFSSWA